ncbi:unnamed protein product [Clonostachys rhizophaga]|uniref:LysM domain-containing protein n=1 Tax=Clonostachys rhizophaga TaxID=160324 RepID=A0A9N9YIU2_9HYPO|nr:unnamed protein product [Clonostachys rhizophaga]
MVGPSLPACLAFGTMLLSGIALADECQPSTWSPKMMSLSSITRVGEVNCRYKTTTGSKINGDTCSSLAKKYETMVEVIMSLNPTLVVEPERAWDGLCGPMCKNTCLGTGKQCCNSKTWRCGNADEDCRANNCYEGACFDKWFSFCISIVD